MRYKWLLLALFLFIWPSSTSAAERVLMIDDAEGRSNDSLRFEKMIRSYRPDVDVKTTSTAVELDAYDAIFLFNEQVIHLSEVVEEALIAYKGKIIVTGQAPKSRNFWNEWDYDEEVEVLTLHKEPLQTSLPIIHIIPPVDAKVLVEGDRYNEKYPYLIEQGKHYVLASTKVDGLKQLVFHFLLEQLFPIQHGHEAYIRLTDINVNTDVGRLEKMTSYLTGKNVPILLSVDPKPKTKTKQTFKENKPLIKLLTELQENHARIIVSSDKWNYDKDIRLLSSLGIYPIGIETNASALTNEDYEVIAQYSSFYFGKQVQYILPSTVDGIDEFTLYPDTLHYTNGKGQSSFRTTADEMTLLNNLETSIISLAYHSYLELEPLQELVEQMAHVQNVNWIEWSEQRAVTKTATETIHFSEEGTIKIDTHRPLYDKWLIILENKTSDIILWILAILVLLFVLLFTAYIIFMRVRLKKRLFNERK